jgi:glycosyltransferase involved in cell wall biosynthesis
MVRALSRLFDKVRIVTSAPETSLAPSFLLWAAGRANVVIESYLPQLPLKARFLQEAICVNTRGYAPSLYFANYYLPPILSRPSQSIVTIHDCQHRVLPGFISPAKAAWLDYSYANTLSNADVVCAISRFEADNLVSFYKPQNPDKIVVTYNSIDWSRLEAEKTSAQTDPYILCVAHPFPHKNLKKVVDAFLIARRRYPELTLLMVGQFTPEERAWTIRGVPAELASRIIFRGFLSDGELGCLYKQCALYTSASFYEGFGMPAVEALGMGAPIVLSDIPSHREVTMGYGLYLNPSAPSEEWAEAYVCILAGHEKAPSRDKASCVRHKYDILKMAERLASRLGSAANDRI